MEAAETALLEFAASDLGKKYPATVATWENAWERFIPFLEFPPEVRKIIYTTNAIESLNYQLRKIIKNRGHFPNDDSVVKLLWLAIGDIEDKRARAEEVAAHVLDDADDGHVELLERLQAAHGIGRRHLHRLGDHNRPRQGHDLGQRQLGVTRTRRQVDHQVVEFAPLHVGQQLADGAVEHWPCLLYTSRCV